jgi:hypothetical protein
MIGMIEKLSKKFLLKKKIPQKFFAEKYIFIHIPKCAGSSFCVNNFGFQVGHLTYANYEKILGLNISEYYTFSIVRNPLDRFLSAYKFLNDGGMSVYDKEYRRTYSKFFEGGPNAVLNALVEGEMDKGIHFKTQVSYLESLDRRLLLSRIFKIEDIRTYDFENKAVERFVSLGLTRVHNKSKGNYDFVVDTNLITELYQEDFWKLGYEIK